MFFYYRLSERIYEGDYYITEDTSVLFNDKTKENNNFDYTISLGANSRILIDLSCETGRCGPLRCFLHGLKVMERELVFPKSMTGELYFVDDGEMTKYSGSMYLAFEDDCYYDKTRDIICFGKPYLEGITIEFTSGTYAVLNDGKITAIFMLIPSLKEKVAIKRGRFQSMA